MRGGSSIRSSSPARRLRCSVERSWRRLAWESRRRRRLYVESEDGSPGGAEKKKAPSTTSARGFLVQAAGLNTRPDSFTQDCPPGLRVDPPLESCRPVLPWFSLTGSPPFKVANLYYSRRQSAPGRLTKPHGLRQRRGAPTCSAAIHGIRTDSATPSMNHVRSR